MKMTENANNIWIRRHEYIGTHLCSYKNTGMLA